MLLSGEFGTNLLLPFSQPPMLLTLLAAGMWADRLGGREVWRIPAAVLLGLAAGVLLASFRIGLPELRWGMAIAVIAVGVMVALQAQLPGALALAIVAVAAVYLGQGLLAGAARPVSGWLGAGAGAVLALAAGVGLAGIIGQDGSQRLIRLAGAAIAAAGALILFGIVR